MAAAFVVVLVTDVRQSLVDPDHAGLQENGMCNSFCSAFIFAGC